MVETHTQIPKFTQIFKIIEEIPDFEGVQEHLKKIEKINEPVLMSALNKGLGYYLIVKEGYVDRTPTPVYLSFDRENESVDIFGNQISINVRGRCYASINYTVLEEDRIVVLYIPQVDVMIVYGIPESIDRREQLLYMGKWGEIIVFGEKLPDYVHVYGRNKDKFSLNITLYHDDGYVNFYHTYTVYGQIIKWNNKHYGIVKGVVKYTKEVTPRLRELLLTDEQVIEELKYKLGLNIVKP